MDFELSDEQRMIADTVSGVLQAINEADVVWSKLVDAGLTSMTFLEAHGGAELDLLTLVPALAEAGRNTNQPPVLCGAILSGLLCARCDIPGFNPLQAVENNLRVAVALPENMSDLNVEGGRLTGHLQLVPAAADAQVVLLCRDGSDHSLSAAVVLNTAGVTVTEQILLDGQQAADITLDKVEVAWAQADEDLPDWMSDAAALVMCAVALGAAEAVRDLTRDYISTREQFGKPIGSFQVLQHQMVDIFHDTEHFSSLVYAAASACDCNDVIARKKTVSALKRFCGTRMRSIAAASIQMHGGIGTTEQYELNTYVKRILVADMLYGTADAHAARLGSLLAADARNEAKNINWNKAL